MKVGSGRTVVFDRGRLYANLPVHNKRFVVARVLVLNQFGGLRIDSCCVVKDGGGLFLRAVAGRGCGLLPRRKGRSGIPAWRALGRRRSRARGRRRRAFLFEEVGNKVEKGGGLGFGGGPFGFGWVEVGGTEWRLLLRWRRRRGSEFCHDSI